jgi:hypothetical protein
MVPNDGRGTPRMELVELESAVVDEGGSAGGLAGSADFATWTCPAEPSATSA